MLARAAPFALVLLICASSAFAQEPYNQASYVEDAQVVSYLLQDQGSDSEDATTELEASLKKLDLRLRELEYDLENKLKPGILANEEYEKDNRALTERLCELEKQLCKQNEAVGKIEESIPGFVHHGHENPKMVIFGRIHLDYWSFPNVDETAYPLEGGNPQDRFAFRRLRIGVKGDINDNMFYKYEGEFADGNDPSYRDAFLGFSDTPYFNTIIIGNQKRPYSLDQLNSSDANVFVERPLVAQAFNRNVRRLGISSNGSVETSDLIGVMEFSTNN